jgi:hypothetical protein
VNYRPLIIFFCLFHMAAIALFALPESVKNPGIVAAKASVMPIVKPYLHLTSQWQSWNLFSPTPLRRVSRYFIDQKRGEDWELIHTIDWNTIPTFRQADELKMIRTLEEKIELQPITERFVREYCSVVEPGTRLRFRTVYHVLPETIVVLSPLWWETWEKEETEVLGPEIICSTPA